MESSNMWKRWLVRVIGAILIATVPSIIWFFLGINRDGLEQPNQNGTNGNGRSIVVNSVGFFWASNNVVIQDGPTPPTLSSHVSKQQAEGK